MTDSSESASIYFSANRPLASFLPAARGLIGGPRAFFEKMPRAIYYRDAMFFVSIVIFAFSFISVPFYSMLFLFLLPVTWGASLIGLWLWARYLRWAVKASAGGKLSSVNAFQISAYAALPMALAAIPYVGALASLLNLYLIWQGLIGFCRIGAGKAAAILLVPVLVLAGSSMALAAMLVKLLPQLAG